MSHHLSQRVISRDSEGGEGCVCQHEQDGRQITSRVEDHRYFAKSDRAASRRDFTPILRHVFLFFHVRWILSNDASSIRFGDCSTARAKWCENRSRIRSPSRAHTPCVFYNLHV
jgi:hypothetical protein